MIGLLVLEINELQKERNSRITETKITHSTWIILVITSIFQVRTHFRNSQNRNLHIKCNYFMQWNHCHTWRTLLRSLLSTNPNKCLCVGLQPASEVMTPHDQVTKFRGDHLHLVHQLLQWVRLPSGVGDVGVLQHFNLQ